jgi:hypothetical protein
MMMAADANGERVHFLVRLMADALSDYEARRSNLAQLVRDVESVIDSLAEVADAVWVAELRELWGTLEIIHAVVLDEGRSVLTDDEQRDVAEIASALGSLVER